MVFGIGFYASRLVKDSNDFLLAGRNLGLVLATATLAATHFGGGFVMGVSNNGYNVGLSGVAYAIGTALGLIVLGLVAAKPLRNMAIYTVPEYLEIRYNSKLVRVMGATLSLVAIVGIVAAQVGASRNALTILGISPDVGAVVATVLFIAYTAFAGMWGVTLTDSIQIIIIFIGLPLVAFMGVNAAGGWSAMRATIASMEVSGGVDSFFSITGIGLPVMIGIILPVIMYDLIGQDFYQRLFSAKDSKTARNAAVLAGLVLLSFGAFPAIAGMASRALFGPDLGGLAPLPKLIVEVLPVGIGAIIIAAILAAVMSTADSLLLAGTSHITKDFNFSGQEQSQSSLLKSSRIWTVILGVAALLFALAVPGIITVLIYSYTMYASGVFVPVVLGILWKRGTAQGAIVSIITGSITGLAGLLKLVSFGSVPVIVAGGAVSLASYIIVSLATQSKEVVAGEGSSAK